VYVVSRESYDCTRTEQREECSEFKKIMKSEKRDVGTDVGERNTNFIRHCSVTWSEEAKQNYLSILLACD
jgi:hypothetical protein